MKFSEYCFLLGTIHVVPLLSRRLSIALAASWFATFAVAEFIGVNV